MNKGIDLVKGKYIATMDCDDISLPKRLQYQVDFMEKNKDIIMCGTFANQISKHSKKYIKMTYPINSEAIKFFSFFSTPFAHPSVFFRKKEFISNNFYYNDKYIAEDFWLWIRVIKKYKTANIPKELILYRVSNFNRCKKFSKDLYKEDISMQKSHWKEMSIENKLNKPFLCSNLNYKEILEREILLKKLSYKFSYIKRIWKLEKEILFRLYSINSISRIQIYIRYLIYFVLR